jgi:hypothetical protein
MRRPLLLLAAPVVAAGILAGCDLPGGSPQVLGPDQVPNDEPPGASVRAPAFINGSVDSNDQVDFFTLSAPPSGNELSNLAITCTGDVTVYLSFGGVQTAQLGEPISCSPGEPFNTPVEPGQTPVIEVAWNESSQLTPYFLSATYSPVDLGTVSG